MQFLIENIIQENARIVSAFFEVYKAVPTLVGMDAAKLECKHPGTLLYHVSLFPWILGVFDTMAIVGNGCGKMRGGWEQPILAICLQYAGKGGRRFMVSDHL